MCHLAKAMNGFRIFRHASTLNAVCHPIDAAVMEICSARHGPRRNDKSQHSNPYYIKILRGRAEQTHESPRLACPAGSITSRASGIDLRCSSLLGAQALGLPTSGPSPVA